MRPLRIVITLIFVCVTLSSLSVRAQTTAFNYQGELSSNSAAANDTYDFRFLLLDAPVGGTPIGGILTKTGVIVRGGLFTVSLDFGANAFAGPNRYLEISVKKSADV